MADDNADQGSMASFLHNDATYQNLRRQCASRHFSGSSPPIWRKDRGARSALAERLPLNNERPMFMLETPPFAIDRVSAQRFLANLWG